MGKSKGGKRSVSSGPHKKHGPKRKLFHTWSSTIRLHFGKAGILKKDHNLESFVLACQAKGLKHGTPEDWKARFDEYRELKTSQERREWLNNCKNCKDSKKKA